MFFGVHGIAGTYPWCSYVLAVVSSFAASSRRSLVFTCTCLFADFDASVILTFYGVGPIPWNPRYEFLVRVSGFLWCSYVLAVAGSLAGSPTSDLAA